MRRIPQATIDQILERTDIVDIVSNYVSLKRRGRNFFGLCPFHKEKTGSFSVHPERQIFKCFGCGKGGTALTFIQAIENLTFTEAVHFLAEKAGVRIEFEDNGRRDVRDRPEIDRTQVLDAAANLFAKWLANSQPARDYLAGRGIDPETARKFRLGYAPDSWEALHEQLRQKGIPDRVQKELGLIIPRQDGQGYYDRFRNRIIFPIANPLGRIVAFGGRVLGDGEPKYLNSPETPLFNKSRTLYLLERAREPIRRVGKTLVVEGYMDAIALHRFGYDFSVATLGTALTDNHARLLRRYGENIYLIYDGDEAGLMAARRGVEVFLSIGLPVRVALVPAGEDPDSLLTEKGQAAMDSVLKESRDGFEFCFDRAVTEQGLESVAARRAVIHDLLPVLARIPEAVVRADYVTFLAGRIGMDEAAVREDLARFRQRRPAVRAETQSTETVYRVRMEDLDVAQKAKLHLVAVLLDALGLAGTERPPLEPVSQPLRAEERECIHQVVDLIPDRQKYPLSSLIKRLLSIKPKTYKNMAALLEGAFAEDEHFRAIVTAAPDLAPIHGDRNRMLFDAAQVLQEQRRKSDHRRLAIQLQKHAKKTESGMSEEERELLRQIDSSEGLGKAEAD